jgi:hypothetical protein
MICLLPPRAARGDSGMSAAAIRLRPRGRCIGLPKPAGLLARNDAEYRKPSLA